MLNLAPEQLKTVRTILQATVPGREVLAFGSRVRGRAKIASDLDLCVMGNEPLSPSQLLELRSTFSDSRLPFKVDIVEWPKVARNFRRIIERDGIPV